MKVVSWNVNGLRAVLGKGLLDYLADEAPDIVCLQETKIDETLVETLRAALPGWHAHFHCAQRKGYSGVAILSRQPPLEVKAGCGHADYDAEGRCLRADFDELSIINTYYPSGSAGDVRQQIKEEFLKYLYDWVGPQLEARPNLLHVGDFNICHEAIDIHHPERHTGVSGFLPQERAWMSRLLAAGLVDTFRHFEAGGDHYSWWTYRSGARAKNLGWRIDYQLAGMALVPRLRGAGLRPQVLGSDHCPTVLELD